MLFLSGVSFVLFCFVSLPLYAPFFRSFFFLFCFFRDVAFSECFCTITVFSLYGEYAVRFFLPDGAFLPCNHGLDFLDQLIM